MGVSYVQGLGFSAFVGFREVQRFKGGLQTCSPTDRKAPGT